MSKVKRKPRVAVVSPFLGKSYGTERTVIEWLNHLPDAFEIHIYSQNVTDLDPDRFIWHRIPTLPGPHLLNFAWWFAANHIWRGLDSSLRRLRYDLIYSPGINCFDADVISVHIVFAEYLRQYGPVTTKETPCAPLFRYGYRRGEIKSCFRSAISPWIDRRQPVDIIRDKLDARGIALLREDEFIS